MRRPGTYALVPTGGGCGMQFRAGNSELRNCFSRARSRLKSRRRIWRLVNYGCERMEPNAHPIYNARANGAISWSLVTPGPPVAIRSDFANSAATPRLMRRADTNSAARAAALRRSVYRRWPSQSRRQWANWWVDCRLPHFAADKGCDVASVGGENITRRQDCIRNGAIREIPRVSTEPPARPPTYSNFPSHGIRVFSSLRKFASAIATCCFGCFL